MQWLRRRVVTIVMTMGTSRTITAAAFKAECLALMDEVSQTGKSILITKRGRPVARLVPASNPPASLRGFWKGNIEIVGDIVSPTGERWEAER